MPDRLFPNDVPSRDPYGRKGIIATRLNNHDYYVDFGRGQAELAYWAGEARFDRLNKVFGVWAHDAGTWWIEGAVTP